MARTTHQSHVYEVDISELRSFLWLSKKNRERLDQQKVIGNLADLIRDPEGILSNSPGVLSIQLGNASSPPSPSPLFPGNARMDIQHADWDTGNEGEILAGPTETEDTNEDVDIPGFDYPLPQASERVSHQNSHDTVSRRSADLRDLESLESDVSITSALELDDWTRHMFDWSSKDQTHEGGESSGVECETSDNGQSGQEETSPISPGTADIQLGNSSSSPSSPLLGPPKMGEADLERGHSYANGGSIEEIEHMSTISRYWTYEEELPIADEEQALTNFPRTMATSSTHPLVSFANLATKSSLQAASNVLRTALKAFTRDLDIPMGMVRVRWTCKCGEKLFDDFIEKRPGSARMLELHLNRPRQRGEGTGSGSSSYSPTSSVSRSPMASHSTLATSFDSGDIANARQLGNRNPYIPITASGSQSGTDTGPFPDQLWLLTCAERQKFTTKLMHLDVDPQKVGSDKELAVLVKEQYSHLRPSWRQFFRLRGLHTIQFVQFEVHRSQVVDIRKCPDLPEISNIDYKFLPSDLIPPVGENYLMHLFHHPEDYEDELITYKRIPKKRGTKLRVCDRADVGVGWGIHLVESFLAHKVWTFFTVIFVFAGLVFAIVWTIQKGDIQGAFGVAAYVCVLSTMVIGCAMAYLE